MGFSPGTEREGQAYMVVPLWGSVYTWVLLKHLINVGQETFTFRAMAEYLNVQPEQVQNAILRSEHYGIIRYDKARRIYVADLERARLYLAFLPKDIMRLIPRLAELPVEFSQAYEYFTAWAMLADASTEPAKPVPDSVIDLLRKYGVTLTEIVTPDGLRPPVAVLNTIYGTLYLIVIDLPRLLSKLTCVRLPGQYGADAWLCSGRTFYLYAYAPSLLRHS
jgi:DNA-binding transcriptional regulator YhcF (GntR family)